MSGRGGSGIELSVLVAEILDAAFLESGLKQSDLGLATGISQSQVSKILRGVRVPDIDDLDRVCRALDLEVEAVVADAAERRRTL